MLEASLHFSLTLNLSLLFLPSDDGTRLLVSLIWNYWAPA